MAATPPAPPPAPTPSEDSGAIPASCAGARFIHIGLIPPPPLAPAAPGPKGSGFEGPEAALIRLGPLAAAPPLPAGPLPLPGLGPGLGRVPRTAAYPGL